ncbi:MAG: L-serine ammonia-lyase, iron-sulfur-dependent, subunit alpha [Pirellulaceae bacterium]|nr:L-serine ammonia-lyase, iron-sulfur-dependent, subunit alpha [Pirellulaceae bacterium]
MRGPSSSHCAAALRIGRLARDLMRGDVRHVLVEFDRGGSLPTTHESQGSDMGLFGGLLGWDAADSRLPDSPRLLAESGADVRIETVDAGDEHPNTYRLTLSNDRQRHFLRAISTGGGMIEVINVDSFPVSMFGDYHVTLIWLDRDGERLAEHLRAAADADQVLVHASNAGQLIEVRAAGFLNDDLLASLGNSASSTPIREVQRLAPVLPVASRRSMRVPFATCAEMLQYDAGRETPLWRLAVEYETERGQLTESAVVDRMVEIVRILRQSIAEGLAGTRYDDRILPAQTGRFQQQLQAGRLLDGGALNQVVLYVSALMEVKSSMGVIVAAPTAGACAALPAAVIGMAEALQMDETEMARALLAAGLVGTFIATAWTFAAEVGGCQAEGGAAASMAAAALVTLAGGTLRQAVAAASMALQSMIGLICDPVANRVEVPCLGKNVMAAANALCCANMALADFDPVIPLDETIATAKRVAAQMPRELRCTALGGLAITPTSLALELQLADRKSAGCGSGCGCGPRVQLPAGG